MRDWERVPGFCTLLLQIAASDGGGLELQRLAVMAAKNMVGRCWVKKARDPRMAVIGEVRLRSHRNHLRRSLRSRPQRAPCG